jgi:hypothetical protein
MKRIRKVMATTRLDRHYERFAPEALESMQDAIRSSYLPFIINHDPRSPPIGRVVDAEIVTLPDGEYGLEAGVEIFEGGAVPPLKNDGRTLPLRELPQDGLLLTIDRVFSDPRFAQAVNGIGEIFGTGRQYEGKKAFEPLGVLIISVGGLAVGAFATAFFSRLGTKAADAFSGYLKQLFQRKTSDEEPRLLRFEFECVHKAERFRIEVILSGPSEEDIDSFLDQGISQLDEIAPSYISLEQKVLRYVFSFRQGELNFQFAVRQDAVPLFASERDASDG